MRRTAQFLQFTEAQRQALDGRRNLAVRANAGSGKTAVLVERIVQLLAKSWDEGRPSSIERFVAITFTRKAAGELVERLRQSFDELLADAPEAEQAYWRRQLHELPQAMIGTIDRFCARILRDYSPPSDPLHAADFKPLDEFEEAALKSQCVERLIERLRGAATEPADPVIGKQREACRWWLETHGQEVLSFRLRALLDHLIDPAEIVAAHRDAAPARERRDELWSALPAVRRLRQRRAELAAALRELGESIEQLDRAGVSAQELQTQCSAMLERLASSSPEDEEAVLQLMSQAFFTKAGDPRTQGLARLEEQVRLIQHEWNNLFRDVAFDRRAEECALEAADRLACLLAPAHADYLRACQALNRFDFLTLARRTRDLLRTSPEACRQLQEHYHHVMVDEFQDTNDLQWEIISRIVGTDSRGELACNRLFIVGDPQQSIYRFRHADVSVFRRVQERIEASNDQRAHLPTLCDEHLEREGRPGRSSAEQRRGLIRLAENFRSLSPAPLEVLDRVFRHVFDPATHGLDPDRNEFEVRYQPFVAGPAAGSSPTGEVRYALPEQPDREPAAEEAESNGDRPLVAEEPLGISQVELVVDQLIGLHGRPRLRSRPGESTVLSWSDMAVLLPSRKTVLRALEKEFRKRGVPFVVTRGTGFWQRQEVRDVVNLASSLADPYDSLSLFGVLRGPLGQLTDTEILLLRQWSGGGIARGLESVGATAWPDSEGPLRTAWEALSPARKGRVQRTAQDLARWRARVDRLDHADLLERCFAESNAWAVYASEPDGDQLLANLDRLFEIVREEEARSAPTLGRLARSLRERREGFFNAEQASPAAGKDAVQIMTVHAAKGLEFPVVAVMKMERRVGNDPLPRLMVVARPESSTGAGSGPATPFEDSGRATHVPRGTINVSVRNPRRPREFYHPHVLRALYDLERAQQLAESRRLFYVAATRAAERLILAGGQADRQRPSWQRWFEDALGITEEDKQRGEWRSPDGRLRLTIVTRRDPLVRPIDASPCVHLPLGAAIDLAPTTGD